MSVHDEKVHTILKQYAGYITATQATEVGIPRRRLTEMCEAGQLCKVDRGIYASEDIWEDHMYCLQYRYGKGIFSHGTALWLHDLSDREPLRFTMTFPRGYNVSGVKSRNIIAPVVKSELYEMGVIEVTSNYGNPLRVYDVERSLCDAVRGDNAYNVELVVPAMQWYARRKRYNIHKLMQYAKALHVEAKIQNYMRALL